MRLELTIISNRLSLSLSLKRVKIKFFARVFFFSLPLSFFLFFDCVINNDGSDACRSSSDLNFLPYVSSSISNKHCNFYVFHDIRILFIYAQ